MEKDGALLALEQKVIADTALPLRSNLVFGEGSSDPKVMFIGEAPGVVEDLQKRPFVGRAGQLLRQMIREIGWKENEVYITNIVKRRPPDNRDPLPNEIEAYAPYLTKQIEIINPRIIVPLGRFSMNYFLPLAKITRDQGKVFKLPERFVVPMLQRAEDYLVRADWVSMLEIVAFLIMGLTTIVVILATGPLVSFIVGGLMAAATEQDGAILVLLALRADFYSHCAPYDALRQALAEQQEYIGPMTPDELRRAIEEPAKRTGWQLEPGLVDVLLDEVEGEPGGLPLLSHALLETWERRRGRVLTLSGYVAAGGVRAAARSVGCHHTTLLQYLRGRTPKAHIAVALRELQLEMVGGDETYRRKE